MLLLSFIHVILLSIGKLLFLGPRCLDVLLSLLVVVLKLHEGRTRLGFLLELVLIANLIFIESLYRVHPLSLELIIDGGRWLHDRLSSLVCPWFSFLLAVLMVLTQALSRGLGLAALLARPFRGLYLCIQ